MSRLDSKIEEILADMQGRGSADWLADQLDDHIAEADYVGVSQDIENMCCLVRDADIDASLDLLEVLTQIRYGDEKSSMLSSTNRNMPGDQEFPRLAPEELQEYARAAAERSWIFWKGLVDKHGWDHDQFDELDHQMDEVNQSVGSSISEKTGDHLRELRQHLVWELWPSLVNAAEERDHAAARNHLATARLLVDELERAEELWKDTTVEDYSFDPLTMSWPRDFWLVLEAWRRGTARQ